MRYRKLTADNDYSFGNGQKDFYRDEPAAVGQSVMTRILLWLGEWYLDTSAGTPYLQGVLGKHSQAEADVTLQQRALGATTDDGTPSVTNLTHYVSTLNPDSRGLNVRFAIDTIYGPTEVQIENYATF